MRQWHPITQCCVLWCGEQLLGLVCFSPARSPLDPINQCYVRDLKHTKHPNLKNNSKTHIICTCSSTHALKEAMLPVGFGSLKTWLRCVIYKTCMSWKHMRHDVSGTTEIIDEIHCLGAVYSCMHVKTWLTMLTQQHVLGQDMPIWSTNPNLTFRHDVRWAYATALEMAAAEVVSQAHPWVQPPCNHTPSSSCHKVQPQCRQLMLHTVCMPCPHKKAGQLVRVKWPLKDWFRTCYLISHTPCHACGCTYTTKVNRKSTKEQKCS